MNEETQVKISIPLIDEIEILKLCNSQCAKETIDILKGENNE